MHDEGWKRLWTRVLKDLDVKTSGNHASPVPSKDSDDSDTALSGPLADDPWERLWYHRKCFNWDEEEYPYEKIFLKEAIKDAVSTQHQDEDGDRQDRRNESSRYVGSRCRNGKLPKKPIIVRSAEPQAVLNSGQARTGRPQRLVKGSKD
ncbi:hypothetical protein F4824DRAFT_500496 [Ustulina deusta]|nr:hypothetical protein F4823DRAFT_568492 [Ustulina deusta]KAI3336004.1 hypothetical protein F4824DRAFT_500496 [Ustulina deusta]